MVTANYIGENIRTLRTKRGLTQLALAHAMGWEGPDAGAQIAKYELGGTEPRLTTLIALAAALSVTIDHLVLPPKKK